MREQIALQALQNQSLQQGIDSLRSSLEMDRGLMRHQAGKLQFVQGELAELYDCIRRYLGEHHVLLPLEQVRCYVAPDMDHITVPISRGDPWSVTQLAVEQAMPDDLSYMTSTLTTLIAESSKHADLRHQRDVWTVLLRGEEMGGNIAFDRLRMRNPGYRTFITNHMKKLIARQIDDWSKRL
ncbi:hypothetical protein [Chromobacterium phragmitis]|nr:hypothetical protein [Chromobacterium phragmitis]